MENDVDGAKCGTNSACLCENDIPGASLGDRDPNALKIPELKRWLICRNASTKGKKADLVSRQVNEIAKYNIVTKRITIS